MWLLAQELLCGCSRRNRADLPEISAIRNAAAEWALVNREAERGRLTGAYAGGMREAARREIASESRRLKMPAAAARARALLALPAETAPAQIEPDIAALKQIETALESA